MLTAISIDEEKKEEEARIIPITQLLFLFQQGMAGFLLNHFIAYSPEDRCLVVKMIQESAELKTMCQHTTINPLKHALLRKDIDLARKTLDLFPERITWSIGIKNRDANVVIATLMLMGEKDGHIVLEFLNFLYQKYESITGVSLLTVSNHPHNQNMYWLYLAIKRKLPSEVLEWIVEVNPKSLLLDTGEEFESNIIYYMIVGANIQPDKVIFFLESYNKCYKERYAEFLSTIYRGLFLPKFNTLTKTQPPVYLCKIIFIILSRIGIENVNLLSINDKYSILERTLVYCDTLDLPLLEKLLLYYNKNDLCFLSLELLFLLKTVASSAENTAVQLLLDRILSIAKAEPATSVTTPIKFLTTFYILGSLPRIQELLACGVKMTRHHFYEIVKKRTNPDDIIEYFLSRPEHWEFNTPPFFSSYKEVSEALTGTQTVLHHLLRGACYDNEPLIVEYLLKRDDTPIRDILIQDASLRKNVFLKLLMKKPELIAHIKTCDVQWIMNLDKAQFSVLIEQGGADFNEHFSFPLLRWLGEWVRYHKPLKFYRKPFIENNMIMLIEHGFDYLKRPDELQNLLFYLQITASKRTISYLIEKAKEENVLEAVRADLENKAYDKSIISYNIKRLLRETFPAINEKRKQPESKQSSSQEEPSLSCSPPKAKKQRQASMTDEALRTVLEKKIEKSREKNRKLEEEIAKGKQAYEARQKVLRGYQEEERQKVLRDYQEEERQRELEDEEDNAPLIEPKRRRTSEGDAERDEVIALLHLIEPCKTPLSRRSAASDRPVLSISAALFSAAEASNSSDSSDSISTPFRHI